jgi:hypothetical protein
MYRSTSFTSALAVGEWSASRPCRFTPGERALGTQWVGDWVDPIGGLDDVEKKKFYNPTETQTPTPRLSSP